MTYIDYYKILEISKTASEKEIKNAYRKMARKFHPDLNKEKDAKSKFQLINEANTVLSDPEKRKSYDDFRQYKAQDGDFTSHNSNGRQSSYSGESGFSGFSSGNDFSDFFSSMFGGSTGSGGRKTRSQRLKGDDYKTELVIDFTDIFAAQKKTFNVNSDNIRITIPAGIDNGQTIKVSGYGGSGQNGGPKGDLYITFQINNNTQFGRVGKNLFAEIELDIYTAILGGEIIFDTLNGKVKLKVKPETQNGTKVKLNKKGVPAYKNEGEPGFLQITYKIKMPKNLNPRQKELFEELAKIESQK